MSEISRGEGGWKQREGHNFLRLRKGRGHEKWAVKRGRVMQICVRDHVFCIKNLEEIGESSDELSESESDS